MLKLLVAAAAACVAARPLGAAERAYAVEKALDAALDKAYYDSDVVNEHVLRGLQLDADFVAEQRPEQLDGFLDKVDEILKIMD